MHRHRHNPSDESECSNHFAEILLVLVLVLRPSKPASVPVEDELGMLGGVEEDIKVEEYAKFIASRNELLGSSGQLPTVRAAVSNSRQETMLRAYHLWEQVGRPKGRDTEIWLEAEAHGRATLDREDCQG